MGDAGREIASSAASRWPRRNDGGVLPERIVVSPAAWLHHTDVRFRTIKVEDEEMQRIRAAEGLEVLKPELGTKPRIYYKNLHMITKCFVGGTVVRHIAGVEECAAGVEVVL